MNQVFLIFALISFILWRLLRPRIKGAIGELKIAINLRFLDRSKYKVINNIVLQNGEGTTQIDHLVIADFGLFVIETKNYKGLIVGHEKSEYWTQILYKRKERLYNPILQNMGHIRVLKRILLDYPSIEYLSIIVFSNKANLKVNASTGVINSNLLLKYIKSNTDIRVNINDKEEIYKKINSLNISKSYDRRNHVKLIKQSITKKEISIKQKKCSQCGGELILRSGKYGKFLGCSSFPRCKFSTKI